MAYKDLSDKRKQQIKDGVKRRRQKIRRTLLEEHGGRCSKCGYDKCEAALEFHHLDPEGKDFTLATTSKSLAAIREEAKKCILVCANCHRELHNAL